MGLQTPAVVEEFVEEFEEIVRPGRSESIGSVTTIEKFPDSVMTIGAIKMITYSSPKILKLARTTLINIDRFSPLSLLQS